MGILRAHTGAIGCIVSIQNFWRLNHQKAPRNEQHLHEQKAKDQQLQYQQAEEKLRDLGSHLQQLSLYMHQWESSCRSQ